MLTASISVHGTEEKYTITTGLSRNEMEMFNSDIRREGGGAVCCHGSIGGERELYSDRGWAEG
jgi:hypothetical protein